MRKITILCFSPLLALAESGLFGCSPAHAATHVVAPSGNDRATGDASDPLRTISEAARRAMPGDMVLVKAGVYRERVSPPRGGEPGKPIVYRADMLGAVFIKGSDLWNPDWKKHKASVYYAAPSEEIFTDRAYLDSPNPFRVELASTPYGRNGKQEKQRFGYGNPELVYTCGQIIVNGRLLKQVPFLAEVESEERTWTYDRKTGRIYVNFAELKADEQTVEITTRRRIFAPHIRGLGHIVVEGFILEHCGNQYPTNFWNTPIWAQAGAIGLQGGHHWVIRNNMIRYANTVAVDIGASGGNNEKTKEPSKTASLAGQGNLIERNYLLDNGAAGIIGAGSTRMIIRDNVILRNNTLGFIGNKRYEHAGIKCHNIKDGLIERNYIADNPLNDGVWLDNRFPGTRVTRNVIVNNGQKGIFLEMSDYDFDTALVDNNILVGNRLIQFYVHDASGSTVMHNLIANSPAESRFGQGAYIYQVTTRTRTGNHSLFNNIFVNHKSMLDINYPSHRSGPQRLDHNIYDAAPAERAFIINCYSDRPSPWTPEQFLELIRADLGENAPGMKPSEDKKRVALTMAQWRAFWEKHGLKNDRRSVTEQGMSVSYDRVGHELTISVPFEGAKGT
ncbi:MAG: right-handed parallel beta-helix repeat-containing protein, partial [Planctomycetota bacterium]